MNERIRELMEQAGVDAGQLFAEMLCADSEVNVKIAEAWNAQPDEVRQRIFETIEQNQSKFAELIIREYSYDCMDVTSNSEHIRFVAKKWGVEL